MSQEYTGREACMTCHYSDNHGSVCRRYPPVPKLEHTGAMRAAYTIRHNDDRTTVTVVVESAFPATFPYAVCGEWREKSEITADRSLKAVKRMHDALEQEL